MLCIDIKEFENRPAEYLEKIQFTGLGITIVSAGKPVALLIPLASTKPDGGANLIDRPVAQPLRIKEFKALTRTEIYEASHN